MSKPTGFFDLPEESYPFTVRFFRGHGQVHEIFVSGPGGVEVPALGGITLVRIEYADGSVTEHRSDLPNIREDPGGGGPRT